MSQKTDNASGVDRGVRGLRRFISSGLLRRMLAALLVVSLLPLFSLSYLALQNYQTAKDDVVVRSVQDFDSKSFEGLEARGVHLAQTMAQFLRERESDLGLLMSLPRSRQVYAAFSASQAGEIWTVRENKGADARLKLPIYREVAFIDASGQEVIKIVNECDDYPFSCKISADAPLKNVSDPANTLYKTETYFAEAMRLEAGQVYVGKPTGSWIPQEEAYAGAQSRTGERYRGVLRFAAPVFEDGKRAGVVVLAMEWLHFIELSAHIAPSNSDYQAEIDPREADFAYVIDAEGWAISHPRHFNIAGVDQNGKPVASINEKDKDDPNNLFRPGNLSLMGFIDPAFPEIVRLNRNGDAAGGNHLTARLPSANDPARPRERALAFATIPYYTQPYNTKAGFGAVVLSTDGARFHLESQLLGKRIDNSISEVNELVRRLAGVTLVVVLLLALFLAGQIAFPILRLTDAAQEIEKGAWERTDLDALGKSRAADEVGRLTRVFTSMAKEIKLREEQLRAQVKELKIVIDEAKRQKQVSEIVDTDFFQSLAERAKTLREQRRTRSASSEPPAPSAGEAVARAPTDAHASTD